MAKEGQMTNILVFQGYQLVGLLVSNSY